MICPKCHNGELMRRGTELQKVGVRERYQCKSCGKYSQKQTFIQNTAKILLLDIETSLMEFYGFSPYQGYIPSKNVIKDWSILCWNAKWLFSTETMGDKVTPKEATDRNDRRILEKLWKLMDEAQIIVHQNGKKFDIPRINFRFLLAGYPEPSFYQQVDTKEVLAKKFGASYNNQDYITKLLGLQQKDDMRFEDWVNCLEGKLSERKSAIQKMFDYNKKDVMGLEEMYLYLRPWIPSHANLGIYADTDKDCCPNCQSTELKWNGQYATPLGLYEGFRCGSCGAIGRSTKKKYKIKSVDVRN